MINATATAFLGRQQPVIAVDTKKKELVGGFSNAGREWQPSGAPETTLVHDSPGDAIGKAIPYRVYDLARYEAWVVWARSRRAGVCARFDSPVVERVVPEVRTGSLIGGDRYLTNSSKAVTVKDHTTAATSVTRDRVRHRPR